MKALHSNILKLMDNIINKIVANIHDFSFSDRAFTRCRKLNATDLIKLILNMGAGSLNSELFHAFPNVNLRMTASAFEQQKAKLKPECFKKIMLELSQANKTLQLLDDKYLVVAMMGPILISLLILNRKIFLIITRIKYIVRFTLTLYTTF